MIRRTMRVKIEHSGPTGARTGVSSSCQGRDGTPTRWAELYSLLRLAGVEAMIRSTSRAIIWQDRHRLPAQIVLVLLSLVLLTGCSLRSMAVGAMADAMARSSTVYARDDDPEFVREALPFGLKTMEGLLLEKPRHKGLLLSACSGFTQYAQAFVVLPADRLEETDLTAARARGAAPGRSSLSESPGLLRACLGGRLPRARGGAFLRARKGPGPDPQEGRAAALLDWRVLGSGHQRLQGRSGSGR